MQQSVEFIFDAVLAGPPALGQILGWHVALGAELNVGRVQTAWPRAAHGAVPLR